MPEIEVKIWTIEKGKLKEIMIPEFDNQIFVVKEKKETSLDKAYKAVKKIRLNENTDKGKIVYFGEKRTLHQNVIDECKEQSDKGNINFIPILKKYYPNLKKSSYTRYSCDYRQYLGIKLGKGRPADKTHYKNTITKKRRRRRKKPSPNSVGYSKKYKRWIKKDEIHKVKLAINTVGFGYIPNTKTIEEQTGFTKHKIHAILDYMIKKGLTEKKHKDGTYVYEMTA